MAGRHKKRCKISLAVKEQPNYKHNEMHICQNPPTSIKEFEFLVNFTTEKTPGPDSIKVTSSKHLRKK